jgi:hypothetical protein
MKRLSKAVASRGYLDKFNGDKVIDTYDPLCILACMSADPKLQRENPAVAAKCASEVAQYLYEKRKPAEPVAAQAVQVVVGGAGLAAGVDHWVAQDFSAKALPAPKRVTQDDEPVTDEDGE